MDRHIARSEYRPTGVSESFSTIEPPPSLRSDLQALVSQTKAVQRHAYDPRTWIARARTLSRLQYPELAVGDAWKAEHCCKTLLTELNRRRGFRLGRNMGFWMRDEAKGDRVQGEDYNAESVSRRVRGLRDEAFRTSSENLLQWPEYDEGMFIPQPYPWLGDRHRSRNEAIVNDINADLANKAMRSSRGDPLCIVRRHAFGGGVGEGHGAQNLGVFAASDIEEGDLILRDRSLIRGCNAGPPKNAAEQLENGDDDAESHLSNDEDNDSPFDLHWIREREGRKAADALLSARCLLSCVQDRVGHPLEHPLIARLTPAYHRRKARTFFRQCDIAVPNLALQQFGVDIFADLHFDTWVLFTMYARLENNCWSDPNTSSLNNLFALFNHSCEPNVEWQTLSDHRTVEIIATRDIEAGEQLFVEYDGFIRGQPFKVRRKRLERWIEDGCQCERCQREEKQSEASDCQSQRSEQISARSVPVWDTEKKPVFPEDALLDVTSRWSN